MMEHKSEKIARSVSMDSLSCIKTLRNQDPSAHTPGHENKGE